MPSVCEAPCRNCTLPNGFPARACSVRLFGCSYAAVCAARNPRKPAGNHRTGLSVGHLNVSQAPSGGQGRGLWPCRRGLVQLQCQTRDRGAQKEGKMARLSARALFPCGTQQRVHSGWPRQRPIIMDRPGGSPRRGAICRAPWASPFPEESAQAAWASPFPAESVRAFPFPAALARAS
jgi:hypothetical protein